MNTDVILRDVPGYEGLYKVSNLGEVYSNQRGSWDRVKNRPCKKSGYRFITLCKDGVRWSTNIHNIVALVWCDNPFGYKEVDHRDGNKSNNHPSNLRWVTRSQNMNHYVASNPDHKLGRKKILTEGQVKRILKANGRIPARDLARKYNVSDQTIYNVWNGNYYGKQRKIGTAERTRLRA
jgi:hypothetical protein